jgi:hypothetical protein
MSNSMVFFVLGMPNRRFTIEELREFGRGLCSAILGFFGFYLESVDLINSSRVYMGSIPMFLIRSLL